MKEYSYHLFPMPLVILGYMLLIFAVICLMVSIFSISSENPFNGFAISFAFIFIGLIMTLFRSKIIIDNTSGCVLKESCLAGMIFSKEKIQIPGNCSGIVIKEKMKKGTGYYRFVLPVSYFFKSADMFFKTDSSMVRLINTDLKRALKIAEFLQSNLKLECIFENQSLKLTQGM